jgi:acetylornithine/N-succinyldiaminopimelate aminotransferase
MTANLLSVYNRFDLKFITGKGCYLQEKSGKKYLDLGAGIAVNCLGYNHPKLVKSLKQNAKKPWHLSNLYNIEGQQTLAQKFYNQSSLEKSFFCNSGAEAIEIAIKIARKYLNKYFPKRNKIACFENSFHGRTITAISASGNKKYQAGFEPLLTGFSQIKKTECKFPEIEKKLKNIGALIIEPIQGEGGINEFSKDFLEKLAKFCKKNKIILIADEIQSGASRTGEFFAYQHSNIQPDIICAAKGIGGGFPLGACLVSEKYAKVMEFGSHGSTYGGNPLAMAIGNTVIDEISNHKFLEKVNIRSKFFKEKLIALQNQFPDKISKIKGRGLMLGIEFKINNQNFVDACQKHQILTVAAANNTVRLVPPLIIREKEIRIACKKFAKILENIK